ncbi:hypothetical protein WN943_009581 [Citrus x changshan-huyou]
MMSNASLDACYGLRNQGNLLLDGTGTLALGDKGTKLGAVLNFKLAELMALMGTPNILHIFPMLSWFNSSVETKSVVKGEEEAAGNNTEGGNKDFLQLLLELQENEDNAFISLIH